ncbi:16S rRNA (guanine(966)-N(2))-methyltransferase RsmD [Candidatus Sumerlaeota bacterium]|nr:16S rRNA (guanine(966)-N(2))-methyltransferase RsmD [Candidatus Sumerlaeota bacterium]
MKTRILGGKHRNTILHTTDNPAVRPTLGRVRENLFNIIQSSVPRCHFLDLYAGFGAVGLEALSRGAERCFFVEAHPPCHQTIGKNIVKLQAEKQTELLKMPVRQALTLLERRGERFDIIFADPPYGKNEAQILLDSPECPQLLESDGMLILQTESAANLPEEHAPWRLSRSKCYGQTALWFFEFG